MRNYFTRFIPIFFFSAMMFLVRHQLTAQTSPLDSEHTKPISIPTDFGGSGSWHIRKAHLQKGGVLTVNLSDIVSDFQNKNNYSKLTSTICYGDDSIKGFFGYLYGMAPQCLLFTSHSIEDQETFYYTATNIPGIAYIYFHLDVVSSGMVTISEWFDVCIEVEVE